MCNNHGWVGYPLDCWRGFAWCAIVLPEMVSSVPGASVMAGDAGLGLGSVGVKPGGWLGRGEGRQR